MKIQNMPIILTRNTPFGERAAVLPVDIVRIRYLCDKRPAETDPSSPSRS